MSAAPHYLPRRLVVLAAASIVSIVSMVATVGLAPAGDTSAAAPASDTNGWTVYHHDPAGSGVGPPVNAFDTTTRAWTSPALDGQLYGEPLVSSGRVFLATENDTVYSLSSATGAVVWSTHLASPVPETVLPCGDIRPTVGITGTPVIDPSRGEIFVVADELVKGKPAHVLVGLSTATGKLDMTQVVDPTGANTSALLQRTGLTLDAGQVVFGFGGNYGDCSSYRGWVVAVNEAGGAPVDFAVDAATGESQGAIWMGGAAPAVDGRSNVWVSVGNGSVTSASHPYDNSDSVLELSSSLRLEQFFAPTTWASDNARDLDLSMEPVLLSDGQVMIAGKSHIVYLLDGAHLGGVGGQQARLGSVCSDGVYGGSAVVGTTVYLPCPSGIVAVQADASPASLRLLWSSGSGGGPPIVAGGLIWTIAQDGTLCGLDPTTGAVRQQASIGAPANHFPTPSVGDGLLLAPSANRVVAFAASSAGTPTTTQPATIASTAPVSHAASPTGNSEGGGIPAAGVAGIVVGVLVVVGAIGWLVWRRRADRDGGTRQRPARS
jgi:outer membrane protein assembly factor BamB